eukprot:4063664-Lingulodinium_polyedra.AAC.1
MATSSSLSSLLCPQSPRANRARRARRSGADVQRARRPFDWQGRGCFIKERRRQFGLIGRSYGSIMVGR